jgi:hypothetical protein
MKLLTVAELQRIITTKKCSDFTGEDFYIVNDTSHQIVGRLEFKPVEVTRIVRNKIYKYIPNKV